MLKHQTTARHKREAAHLFFDTHTDWSSVRDLANYLGCTNQCARYYIHYLTDKGYLDVRQLKVKGRDGIIRPANHYKKRSTSV